MIDLARLSSACASLFLGVALVACGDTDDPVNDLCAPGEGEASILLGQGVGGAFQQYTQGEQVGLDVAPQGGFGVTVIVRSTGLLAGEGQTAAIQLNVEIGDVLAGEFLEPAVALRCGDDGGQLTGIVVGFDPNIYKTNDDLIQLDGQEVDLVVTATDTEGNSATVRQAVTVVVGG